MVHTCNVAGVMVQATLMRGRAAGKQKTEEAQLQRNDGVG